MFVNASLEGVLDVEVIDDPRPPWSRSTRPGRACSPRSPSRVGRGASPARRAPAPEVNYHLRALEAHGLVRLVEERAWGGIMERIFVATAASYIVSPGALGAASSDPAGPIGSPRAT